MRGLARAPLSMGAAAAYASRQRGGGGGSSAGLTSTEWRINVTDTQSPGSWATVLEVEMRDTVGGSDLCEGGVASASHVSGSDTADKAFDNNTGTRWATGTGTRPNQLAYAFPEEVAIKQVSLLHGTATDAFAAFDVQRKVGASWETVWSEVSANWGANYKRAFALHDPEVAGFAKWRARITATRSGGGAWAAVSGIEFRSTPGGADETAPTGVSNEGEWLVYPANASIENAFDDNTGTNWQSPGVPSDANPGILGYRFSSQKDIQQIAIRNSGTLGDSPKTLTVEYFDPLANAGAGAWVVSWAIADTAFSTTGETKVFTRP